MSVTWKGSIKDTYEKNTSFGGPTGVNAKNADMQQVDFIKTIIEGEVAVGGFRRKATKDKSDMNLSEKILSSVRTHSKEKSTFAIGKKYSEGVNK